MKIDRRSFIGGTLTAFGGVVLPVRAFGTGGKKLMSFGVVSDVHVGSDRCFSVEKDLEGVFRHFDANGVDAVMIPGDIAHSGKISELRRFAAIWDKVFPGGRGADGRSVEKLFVTGNHDLDAWWVKGDEDYLAKTLFNHGDNLQRVWRELFHEDWQLIWKKTVKGCVFVGAQWPTKEVKPSVEQWFRDHAGELRGTRPFFFTQHAHPQGTCHGAYGGTGSGGPEARRALNAFPNAVAFTGHSHSSIADGRTVWQGEFTSIGAGCMIESGSPLDYANVSYHWYRPSKDRLMARTPWIDRGGNAMIVDVYEDHLVIHRHSVRYNAPIGEDWAVPLPAAYGRGFDFKVREKLTTAPRFAKDARVSVGYHKEGHPAAKKEFAKVPCYAVAFPPAFTPNGTVFDYRIDVTANGRPVRSEKVFANGFGLPKEKQAIDGLYLVRESDLPKDAELEFAVTPSECFGKTGASIRGVAPRTFTIEDAPGYNCWPMIQPIGKRLVAIYTIGRAHSPGERGRSLWTRYSDDRGETWSAPKMIFKDAKCGTSSIGKGVDRDGAALFWVRRIGIEPRMALYRTKDGLDFDLVSEPRLEPNAMQITDVFATPEGLMCLWFSDDYDPKRANKSWGTLTSADNGRTWTQHVVEKDLPYKEWPTEPSVAVLGGGRLLAISRRETGGQCQLESTDWGRTWTKTATNIVDVCQSTPSLIYDARTGLVHNYYFHRGPGMLKVRVAKAEDVWRDPTAWPEPTVIGWGEKDRPYDSGNANAVEMEGRHYITFYAGDPRNCRVLVTRVCS